MNTENQAGLARVTCGWPKPGLPLDQVRRYLRDVHAPAISRRAGVYEYRHSPFDPVQADFFQPIEGIELDCDPDAQLKWQSDVRYRDEAGLAAFTASPGAEVRAHLLQDIEMLIDQSTTYRVMGANARTLIDKTSAPIPIGPCQAPTYGIFFRQRSSEDAFRNCVRGLAERWSQTDGVLRVRMNLFEVPDMEAERRAGYPIKTHPPERQYQAWIELVLNDRGVAQKLLSPNDGVNYSEHIRAIHAYPAPAVYTFVYQGRPTLAGLRGYPAYEAIKAFNAENQQQPNLLEWMYGPVVQEGPAR